MSYQHLMLLIDCFRWISFFPLSFPGAVTVAICSVCGPLGFQWSKQSLEKTRPSILLSISEYGLLNEVTIPMEKYSMCFLYTKNCLKHLKYKYEFIIAEEKK